MTSLRALLARVARLQQARVAPRSLFEREYGSFDAFDAFEEGARAAMAAGVLDTRDMPAILNAIRRWHVEGLWRW
jgi:hypothetical protein